jgi:sulfate adenylyltransferase
VSALNPPHGGELVNLHADEARVEDLKSAAKDWPSWNLTPRQLCDLELLLDGGFSPLRGFMTQQQHASVCRDMRLPDGTLWPIPIPLDVGAETAAALHVGAKLALRDPEGVMLAVLTVEDVYEPDRAAEAEQVFGTTNTDHPGVDYLMRRSHPWYVGGTVEGVARPHHYDFTDRRLTPAQLRKRFEQRGWERVVAFQTRNPMHRAHQELTLRAARDADAALLIHPSVGMTKPGDVDHFTRVRCYEALLEEYPDQLAELSLLPLAMRMGGPREALWHAIIRKNHGCTHLIVGRDHAGPGSDSSGTPFYGPYDAQELLEQHTDELGIEMVPFRMMVYLPAEDRYAPVDEVSEGTETASISGTELRQRLASGDELPSWFTFPAVAEELRRTHPPRSKQGFTVFFTGLSGSGKSTIANVLQTKLLERGGRSITMLDGDLVRKHLSSELGFSKEHRDINIRRIGFVASEVTRHGGIAVCAPIAPYAHTRQDVRDLVESGGGFVLIHVSTPVEVCEQRDRKGLYAKARAGIIKEFTGISDPYEEPTDAEITIDTTACSPEEAAERILDYLTTEGYLAS